MPKIVRLNKIGGPEVLRLEECELDQPGPTDVRIQVQAIGLNRAEVLFRQGLYLESPELPARIGYEAAGIVDAVGSDVTQFKIGDYVSTVPGFSQSKQGVYGEQAVVPAQFVAHMPDSM
ncbi:MAG: alcohol dehydrogenase catalytic domain-containing protein, partial [Cyanobacteria bacterium]|nr:alcohol dehydrogenase catalytic domain-containing protein [Cyanobacteriota bacterium]